MSVAVGSGCFVDSAVATGAGLAGTGVEVAAGAHAATVLIKTTRVNSFFNMMLLIQSFAEMG
jgi:hypothetical protein